jgi:hypothetical protein
MHMAWGVCVAGGNTKNCYWAYNKAKGIKKIPTSSHRAEHGHTEPKATPRRHLPGLRQKHYQACNATKVAERNIIVPSAASPPHLV